AYPPPAPNPRPPHPRSNRRPTPPAREAPARVQRAHATAAAQPSTNLIHIGGGDHVTVQARIQRGNSPVNIHLRQRLNERRNRRGHSPIPEAPHVKRPRELAHPNSFDPRGKASISPRHLRSQPLRESLNPVQMERTRAGRNPIRSRSK